MFLLFFLMVALGMLSILWLYFPVPAAAPPDPFPPQPQAVVTVATPPAVAVPDAAPVPSDTQGSPGAAAGTISAGPAPPAANETPSHDAPGSSGSVSPERIDIDDLRRQLEQLLGNPPPPGR